MLKKTAKVPDYLIIDNFAEIFGLDENDMAVARGEAESAARLVCD